MFRTMSLDLNTITDDWPYESGSIKVRKITGLDGREKLQLRVDLGVLQMEMTGRPDGRRPHNCESLLEYHQKRAGRAEQKGEGYELTPEQCAELQQEGIQYYHRYLSLFQINDFEGVVRDTQRNLDLFTFVNQHTDREDFSWSLQQFRPYVLMMNTRAKAPIFKAGDYAARNGNRDRKGTLRTRCRVARRNQAAQNAKAGLKLVAAEHKWDGKTVPPRYSKDMFAIIGPKPDGLYL